MGTRIPPDPTRDKRVQEMNGRMDIAHIGVHRNNVVNELRVLYHILSKRTWNSVASEIWLPGGKQTKSSFNSFGRNDPLTLRAELILQVGLPPCTTSAPANAISKQHSWCSGEWCCAGVNCRPCAEHWCTASIIALPPSMEPKLLFMTLTHAVMGISLLRLYWACVETGNIDKYGAHPQHQ